MCPNGDIAYDQTAAANSLVVYAVDANLTTIRLPPIQYLLPPGTTIPSSPTICRGNTQP
jgi:hypothetical protein